MEFYIYSRRQGDSMGDSIHDQKGESLAMTSDERSRSSLPGIVSRIKPPGSRIPNNHVLYERLLPVSILVMTIIMTALIIFAAGVLLGLIPFS